MSSQSIRRRPRSADRCMSVMCFRTPIPTSSRGFSACAARPCSIRWDGTTTVFRPNAACRITSACAAIRRCPTIRRSCRRRSPASMPIPVSRPNFIELCARLTAEDEKVFEHLWRHLGLSVDWSMTYATIDRRSQRISQLSFLRLLRSRHHVSARSADLVGHRFPNGGRAGRARGSRTARRVPSAAVRHAPIATATVTIDTTRPELIPACVALVAHPDDERYQAALRHRRRHAAVRRACPGAAARACRSREGNRRRHDLHVRRRHRRHVVARAESAGARDHSAERRVQAGDVGRTRVGVGRCWLARRRTTISSPGCPPSRRAPASSIS